MQKIHTTSLPVISKLCFSILLAISLLILFLIKNTLTVHAYSTNEIRLSDLYFNGNVGIGETNYDASPSATPSTTPFPTPFSTPSASPSATPSSSPTPAPDLIFPMVNITSPSFGSLVTGIIQILADAWDNIAVDRVEFYADGNFLGIGSSSPYSTSWDTRVISDGTHVLSAKVFDTSGNEASSSSAIWVSVDNTPPAVSLDNPVEGSLVSGVVVLQASAWDGIGLSEVYFYVDQILIGSSSVYPYAVSWNTAALAAGSTHTIYARAYDLAYHQTASNIVNVTVADTTAPSVAIISPVGGATVSGVAEITASAFDDVNVTKVEFYVDGNLQTTSLTTPYSTSWDTTIYPNNSQHNLTVKAYDAAGNIGIASTTVAVADITLPSVSITYPANGSTVRRSSTVTITANATDTSGISKVEFYVNGNLKCTDTTNSYSCNWLVPSRSKVKYNLQAKAYDAAGNISTSNITVTSR